jgi:hypothetical protein
MAIGAQWLLGIYLQPTPVSDGPQWKLAKHANLAGVGLHDRGVINLRSPVREYPQLGETKRRGGSTSNCPGSWPTQLSWLANAARNVLRMQRHRRVRVFALLSALMWLVSLACIPAVFVCLFLDWRFTVALVPVGVVAALVAERFDGLSLRARRRNR